MRKNVTLRFGSWRPRNILPCHSPTILSTLKCKRLVHADLHLLTWVVQFRHCTWHKSNKFQKFETFPSVKLVATSNHLGFRIWAYSSQQTRKKIAVTRLKSIAEHVVLLIVQYKRRSMASTNIRSRTYIGTILGAKLTFEQCAEMWYL